MRLIGKCSTEVEAEKFTAYLKVQEIDAVYELTDGEWDIWVRDEDKTGQARDEFRLYQADPAHSRYENAVERAEQLVQAEAARRLEQHRRMAERAGEFQQTREDRPRPARLPKGPRPVFVRTVIAASVLATLLSWFGNSTSSGLAGEVFDALTFVSDSALAASKDKLPWGSIQQGELWRLITPIFLHMSFQHILFNSLALYIIGRQIEWQRGPYFLAFFILLVGLAANVGQALLPLISGEYVQFGGLSGVIYGVFGYVWICSRTRQGKYFMPDFVVFVMLSWFVICWLGEFGVIDNLRHIANWNHTCGLLAGIIWAIRTAPRESDD